MSELQGRRLPDDFDKREDFRWEEVQPGDYWRPTNRPLTEWWFRDPFGNIGSIAKHAVEIHEDGTITVSPSILSIPSPPGWHGWLKKGVWTW